MKSKQKMNDETFRELCLAHAAGALGQVQQSRLVQALANADEERLVLFAEAVIMAQALLPASRQGDPVIVTVMHPSGKLGSGALGSGAQGNGGMQGNGVQGNGIKDARPASRRSNPIQAGMRRHQAA